MHVKQHVDDVIKNLQNLICNIESGTDGLALEKSQNNLVDEDYQIHVHEPNYVVNLTVEIVVEIGKTVEIKIDSFMGCHDFDNMNYDFINKEIRGKI